MQFKLKQLQFISLGFRHLNRLNRADFKILKYYQNHSVSILVLCNII